MTANKALITVFVSWIVAELLLSTLLEFAHRYYIHYMDKKQEVILMCHALDSGCDS